MKIEIDLPFNDKTSLELAKSLQDFLSALHLAAESSGYERGFQRAYAMKDMGATWNFSQKVPGIIVAIPKENS